ncbi:MAG: bifunctional methylenetetrahydrofolate dehydrogenase/methenyltetrahydrofolate cyclohydrolase FolD [Myxococcales bacterium]|nr:bifunctional methylenetetrahydrofolate dehydrogenase/methenyltetrahydrofolate cyclohydrolase FolD [Myxococcales bacterium]
MNQASTTRLDGKAMAALLRAEVTQEVAELHRRGVQPGLAVLLVGDDPASAVYVGSKLKACAETGIHSVQARLPANADAAAIHRQIDEWNADNAIDGILVQLPLPKGIDTQAVIERVGPFKDVDGFHPENLGRLAAGRPGLVACTPAGIMDMLARWGHAANWTLAGKHAVVLGRSITVGRPMALLLMQADATVTICHSRSLDVAGWVARADLLVAAVGSPRIVQGDWLKPGSVVIDVGIHRGSDGRLTGDVDFNGALGRVAAITPVPGGVGPMTIAQLMRNTVLACRWRQRV